MSDKRDRNELWNYVKAWKNEALSRLGWAPCIHLMVLFLIWLSANRKLWRESQAYLKMSKTIRKSKLCFFGEYQMERKKVPKNSESVIISQIIFCFLPLHIVKFYAAVNLPPPTFRDMPSMLGPELLHVTFAVQSNRNFLRQEKKITFQHKMHRQNS